MSIPQSKIFRKSEWLWPETHHHDMHNCYALFRKSFTLTKIPSKAPIHLTADQSYRLFVNGHFICRGPARGFQASWPYDEVDIRPWLRKGKNVIAVRAYNPGYSNFQYLTEGFAGFLLAATWADLATNSSWKGIRQAGVIRDTVPVSMQLFSQEHIDLRQESDWTALDFDDSAWKAPACRTWNAAPWFSLEPRGTPMLNERVVPIGKLIGASHGTSAIGYEHPRDVVAVRNKEDRSHQPSTLETSPLKVQATGQGKFRSYLFDFGKTMVGNLSFALEGTKGGEIIDTFFCETIDEKTLTPDLAFPGGCRMSFGDRVVCPAGKATHHFYHHYGFRYLEITVRDATGDFNLTPHLNWVGYPLKHNGSFASSDTDLERIWESCAWTQQCCSLDAYVDTPWREQAQWWGDARVQAWNTFYLDGDARLFRRGIKQIASQSTPDGVTYGHSPTMAHSCILPDFTLIWMMTLWDYYWQTESIEPFIAHEETLTKALDYFRASTDPKSGLITYDPRFWLFLDWTTIFKDGTPTVYNLWLLIALDKIALLYRKARRPQDAVPLEKWAGKLRLALGKLINSDGLIRDGIDRKGKIVPEASIHSQTLAIQAGLKGINIKNAFEKLLLPFIREEKTFTATPSAYWVTYVFTLLIEHGYEKDVLAYIKKYWTPMADHGTTWETFNVITDEDNSAWNAFKPERGQASFSHAWSAHPLYHLMQSIGGVTQTGSGWSAINFKPVFLGTHGSTVIPSPRGKISSSWKKSGDKIKVKLQLPARVRAKVHLPGLPVKTITGPHSWVIDLQS